MCSLDLNRLIMVCIDVIINTLYYARKAIKNLYVTVVQRYVRLSQWLLLASYIKRLIILKNMNLNLNNYNTGL